ncbi:hypothetical protein L1887_05520 [Cichorium endivia]|nr:hypothetical protein L1887_05520 [Cichorium endivia]
MRSLLRKQSPQIKLKGENALYSDGYERITTDVLFASVHYINTFQVCKKFRSIFGSQILSPGKKIFANEVGHLLTVKDGFCQEKKGILVYEFLHDGNLKRLSHGPLEKEQRIKRVKRLEIA